MSTRALESSGAMPRGVTRAKARQVSDVTLDVEALYRRYGDMVLGRCRTLLSNEMDAQDACQEVFLKAHRFRHTFQGRSKPSTWLFRVTTTTCLNRLRSRGRRREDLQEEDYAVPVEDTMLTSHAVRDLVQRTLDEADEKTQSCIIFHFVDGMTYAEIGELLGLSGAAIRKRIATFRKRLQANPPAWLGELDSLVGE